MGIICPSRYSCRRFPGRSRHQLLDDFIELSGVVLRGLQPELAEEDHAFGFLDRFLGPSLVDAMRLHVLCPRPPGCEHTRRRETLRSHETKKPPHLPGTVGECLRFEAVDVAGAVAG